MAVATAHPRLPRWLAPVPNRLEDLGLRLAWLVVAVNLAGTAFGFWYYRYQFVETATVMWPFVPDSPLATLLIALAIAAWKLGYEQPWLTALAFFGNLILGLWTPFTLVVFADQFAAQGIAPAMYAFLFGSHLAMALQALVLYRISDFPPWAIAVALCWYTLDLVVDYFVPVVGEPHHTTLPVARDEPIALGADALGIAGAGATVLTLLALFLAFSTHVYVTRPR
ncbi:putative membrane protein [Halovivax ruber XH-70]|uniref:Putative membrane protein n=1 Tax=Halovivax ruber (strain DSM 18193 / JCM 13892 / XH-70) TaxID=797302 RepID=L0IEX4_HALRX|nr:DUF1405 domain-containing protein [Halovivax ruber]AGB16771.1 putative membrane protein [Halovivax ruber XH-70]